MGHLTGFLAFLQLIKYIITSQIVQLFSHFRHAHFRASLNIIIFRLTTKRGQCMCTVRMANLVVAHRVHACVMPSTPLQFPWQPNVSIFRFLQPASNTLTVRGFLVHGWGGVNDGWRLTFMEVSCSMFILTIDCWDSGCSSSFDVRCVRIRFFLLLLSCWNDQIDINNYCTRLYKTS